LSSKGSFELSVGEGASKRFDKFKGQITVEAPVKPAAFLNQAGIVGAALYAQSKNNHSRIC
jgi:polyphosphate glucokinase